MKIQNKKIGGGGGVWSVWGGGRVRVDGNGELKLLWKLKKKFFWGGGVGSGGGRVGGQGGCERRSKDFVKIQKKKFEGGGVGVGGWSRGGVRSGVRVGEVGEARFGVGR